MEKGATYKMSKNFYQIKVPTKIKIELENIKLERYKNKNTTKEKKIPPIHKIIKLALRHPKMNYYLRTRPAREDV